MAPVNKHALNVAHPIYETPGIASGTFTFPDGYLSPQVQYLNFPPVTEITIGGRIIEVPNQVSVKCRLLEPEEDRLFWTKRSQHKYRVCLGDHHRDFGDVEVAYSFTTPCTHIWFAGYAIHIETAEKLAFLSYNATVKVTPNDVLPEDVVKGQAPAAFPVGEGMEVRRIRTRVRKPKEPKSRNPPKAVIRDEAVHAAGVRLAQIRSRGVSVPPPLPAPPPPTSYTLSSPIPPPAFHLQGPARLSHTSHVPSLQTSISSPSTYHALVAPRHTTMRATPLVSAGHPHPSPSSPPSFPNSHGFSGQPVVHHFGYSTSPHRTSPSARTTGTST